MSELKLKAANLEDLEKEWQFVTAMPEDENGLTNQWSGISREDFEKTAIQDMLKHSKGLDMPDWMVPETFYFLWKKTETEDENKEEIVGQFRIRHYLNDALRTGGGHIGYFIKKEFRGKGYATEGLRLTLEEARKIIPEDEIYLRVNLDNPASLRVMQKNGGRVVGEDSEHYFVRISK